MKKTLILNKKGMGHGPDELTEKLLTKYLSILIENNDVPNVVCCYGDGIKNILKESPVAEVLKALHAKGTMIMICGTCVEFFGVKNEIVCGDVCCMNDIIQAQNQAERVVVV